MLCKNSGGLVECGALGGGRASSGWAWPLPSVAAPLTNVVLVVATLTHDSLSSET